MILTTGQIKAESRNGKARKYEFYHPRDLRKCSAWFPVSQIKELKTNQIMIPEWLWESIKAKL